MVFIMLSHLLLLVAASLACAALTIAERRLKRLGNGANVCLWFRGRNIPSPDESPDYIDDAEMVQMRQLGIQHVRLCVHPQYIYDPLAPSNMIEPNMTLVEKAISRFLDKDIAVVFDFHNENQKRLETDIEWRNGMVPFWGSLAKRLSKFDAERVVLEVINEPVFKGHEQEWLNFQPGVVSAMRESAPDHTIMATSTDWSNIGHLIRLKPLADKDVIYTFHCYDPHIFTHQGATWSEPFYPLIKGLTYPSSPEKLKPLVDSQENPDAKEGLMKYGEQRWNGDKLREHLRSVVEWSSKNKVPIYCGEFGCFTPVTPPEDRMNWFNDISSAFNEFGIGWAVWGYDEVFGLNRRKVDGKAVYDERVAKVLFEQG